jgi:hypothetical protein
MTPPPVKDPIPRFLADSSQEPEPYGRWADILRAELNKAIEPLRAEAGTGIPDQIDWFPERAWGGRVYVPWTALAEGKEGVTIEWFGYVSFVRPAEGGEGDPGDFTAVADYTDVIAADNPDWKIDLNEEVVGAWRGEGSRKGDVTLVWGSPLVRGAHSATAELGGGVIDQAPVLDERFTLVAVDAVKGFGDDLFLEVRVWHKRGVELAAESLYAEPEGEADPVAGDPPAEPDPKAK